MKRMPREIVTVDGKSYRYRDYQLPPLGEGEVRIRVLYAAPKHGTESHAVTGSAFDRKVWDPELRLFLPRGESTAPEPQHRGIGNMFVGSVVELGAGTSRFHRGDRVFGYGSIREEHQASEDALRPLGDLSYEDAVCTDPAHVALVAVRDGSVRIGDDVAVFGLGAIGLLAVQIARASGARRVFAVDPFALRREYALAHGADAAFDPSNCDVALEIKLATQRTGVDISIETSGNGGALHQAIRCIRQCGTVVHVPWGPRDASMLRMDEEFHLNRPTLIGSQAVWQNPDRSHPMWTEQRARDCAVDLFRRGLVTGQGMVTPVFAFSEAAERMVDMVEHPERTIKIGVRLEG